MTRTGNRHHQILIVDDEQGLRELLQENLEDAGYICFAASNGRTALDIMSAESIDLAIVDVMMPEMSGLELFQLMRGKYPWVAVVFVTAVDQMDVAVSQVKNGAMNYLVKPVSKTRLIDAVSEALNQQSEFLENTGHQQHLEELLVHQSKALENKVREVRALNKMFDDLVANELVFQDGINLMDQQPETPSS
ncbi:MAG: response regulator [Chloroflexi bacterium]|nr:response regulator [Chloroflexota bacterium]